MSTIKIPKQIKIVPKANEIEKILSLLKAYNLTNVQELIRFLINTDFKRIADDQRRYGSNAPTAPKQTKAEKLQETKLKLIAMSAKEAGDFIRTLGYEFFYSTDRLEYPEQASCFDMLHHEIVDTPDRGRIMEAQLYRMDDPEKKIHTRREICSFDELLNSLISKKLI